MEFIVFDCFSHFCLFCSCLLFSVCPFFSFLFKIRIKVLPLYIEEGKNRQEGVCRQWWWAPAGRCVWGRMFQMMEAAFHIGQQWQAKQSMPKKARKAKSKPLTDLRASLSVTVTVI